MDGLKQEAKLLIIDAKNIADNIDKEISIADKKHAIGQICKNYAWLWGELDKEEDK